MSKRRWNEITEAGYSRLTLRSLTLRALPFGCSPDPVSPEDVGCGLVRHGVPQVGKGADDPGFRGQHPNTPIRQPCRQSASGSIPYDVSYWDSDVSSIRISSRVTLEDWVPRRQSRLSSGLP